MAKIKREDFPTMPDEDLRIIYKERLKMQKLVSAPPLFVSAISAVIFWLAGYFQQTIFNTYFKNPIMPVLIPIGFFVLTFLSAMLMFGDDANKHMKAAVYITIGQFLIFSAGMFFDLINDIPFLLMSVCMAMTCFGHIIMIYIINDLNALRECPSFPFENHRRENTYLSGMRTEHGDHLTSSADTDNVKTLDYDSILNGEPDKADKKKEEDTSDFFQQSAIDYTRNRR